MPVQPVFAFLSEGTIALLIPILGILTGMVAILVSHQQKMAQIIHSTSRSVEVEDLRKELMDLKSIIHGQAYAIEELRTKALESYQDSIKARLGNNL